MSYPFPPDVAALIRQQMATGRFASEDQVLREALERLNNDDREEEEDVQAVLEAIEELEQGDEGMELDEAFEEIRLAVEKRLKT